jgi:hypothetical protein
MKTQLELIEKQIYHEIHAGEYGPHIHGVGPEFYNVEDGTALPIIGGRAYKIAILKLLRDSLKRELG